MAYFPRHPSQRRQVPVILSHVDYTQFMVHRRVPGPHTSTLSQPRSGDRNFSCRDPSMIHTAGAVRTMYLLKRSFKPQYSGGQELIGKVSFMRNTPTVGAANHITERSAPATS